MKKKFLFWPLAAAMAFTGCTSDEPTNPGNSGDSDTHYLAVSIITTPTAGESRAYTEGTNQQFEDGTADENKVNKVRFYFFSRSDNPVVVNAAHEFNYQDWTPKSETVNPNDNHETVSNQLEAVLIINTQYGDRLPSKVIAVINPPSALDGQSLDLAGLISKATDFVPFTDKSGKVSSQESLVDENVSIEQNGAATPNGFVMSNAVFINEASDIEYATPIEAASFAKTKEAAIKNPLKIYVERTVAKVRVNLGGTLTSNQEQANVDGVASNLIKLQYKDADNNGQVKDLKIGEGTDAKQVYVNLRGWNVTGDLNKAYLIKNLKEEWITGIAGYGTSWNNATLHRCYWADYCNGASNKYDQFRKDGNIGFGSFTYCNENANRSNTDASNILRETDVIIPAILCDNNGSPFNLTEFAGQRLIDDDNFTTTKNQIVGRLQDASVQLWREETTASTDGQKSYREMNASDISFKPIYDAPTTSDNHRYYAKVSLPENVTWYKQDPSKTEAANLQTWQAGELTALFAPYNTLKVWTNGQTYYYLPIPHSNNNNNNINGVVRNHLYDITITGIYGLGTPVCDASQEIIPEVVDPEDVFVAAQVNILDWRIVSKEVELDWGN